VAMRQKIMKFTAIDFETAMLTADQSARLAW